MQDVVRDPRLSELSTQWTMLFRAHHGSPEEVNDALRLMMLFVEMHKIGSSVIIATHNLSLVERFPFPRLHLENGAITLRPPILSSPVSSKPANRADA